MFITVSRQFQIADTGDNDLNDAKTAYYQCELKPVNYFPDMIGQLRTDFLPANRPGANPVINNNDLPETTLQVSVGSKLIPTLPLKGGQQIAHLAMALGLDSKREGFLNHLSFRHNKSIWGLNWEVYTGTDLDNAGLATRAGESIQVHYEGLGLPNYFPDKIFIHLRSTSKLELRTGSARLLD